MQSEANVSVVEAEEAVADNNTTAADANAEAGGKDTCEAPKK